MDRHLLRLEKTKPLLEQIKAAIQTARGSALPKSVLAKSLRLHADALGSAQSFPGISGVGTLQLLGRERDASDSNRPQLWTVRNYAKFDRLGS
jgi:hypothetical protein